MLLLELCAWCAVNAHVALRFFCCRLFCHKHFGRHQQRKEAFFKRPDACETAFNALGIKYSKPSLAEEKPNNKPTNPEYEGVTETKVACCTIS